MNPKIKEVVDYIRVAHPESSHSLDEVIRDCAAHGFSPVQIMAGLQLARGVSPRDAKEVVIGHPVWGSAKTEWVRFHKELIESLDAEADS